MQWQERPAEAGIGHRYHRAKRAEEALLQSEEQYRSLFEDSPISLWVEDFSGVKQRLDELKKMASRIFQAYLREHPDFVSEFAKQVRILDVNSAALKIFHARHKSELLGNLADILPTLHREYFEHELIQIANGRLNFEWEEVDHTLTGEEIHVNIRWSVAPGYEDSLAKVIVSTMDITERKQAQEALRKMNGSYPNHSVSAVSAVGVMTLLRIPCNTRMKCIACWMFRREDSRTPVKHF